MGRLIFPRLEHQGLDFQPAYRRPSTVADSGMNHYGMRDLAQGYGLAKAVGQDIVGPIGDAVAMAAQRRAHGTTEPMPDNFDVNDPSTYGTERLSMRTEPDGSRMDPATLFRREQTPEQQHSLAYRSRRTGAPIIAVGPMRGGNSVVPSQDQSETGATDQAAPEGARQPQRVDTSFQDQIPDGFPRANIPQPIGAQPIGREGPSPEQIGQIRRPEKFRLNVDPNRIHTMDELQTLVGAAHRTGHPQDFADVAAAIDRAPFDEARPKTWVDWFTGNHQAEARRDMKDRLLQGQGQSAASVANDIRLQSLEHRALVDELRAPEMAAKGEIAGVKASHAEEDAQLSAELKALKSGVEQMRIQGMSAKAVKGYADAQLAQISAQYGEEKTLAQIELMRGKTAEANASAGLKGAQKQTEDDIRENKVREMGNKADMWPRVPATNSPLVVGGSGSTTQISGLAKEITASRGNLIGAKEALEKANKMIIPTDRDEDGDMDPKLTAKANAAKQARAKAIAAATSKMKKAQEELRVHKQRWDQLGANPQHYKDLLNGKQIEEANE